MYMYSVLIAIITMVISHSVMLVQHKAVLCVSLLLITIILPNRLQNDLNLKYSTYLIST